MSLRAGRRAAAAGVRRHPRRPGPLRRRQRRPQPDPLVRPGRHSVGLPGVIAHGMFTMALAARAVDDLGRRPGPGRARSAASSPSRSSSPTTTPASWSASPAPSRPSRTTGRVALEVTCGGEKVLGMPKAVLRPARVAERLADHTTLRLGGPAERAGRAHAPRTSSSTAVRRADAAGEPVAGARRRQQPRGRRRGFAGTVVEVATRGRRPSRRDTCGGAFVTVAAGEGWDELVDRAVERGLGRRRGAVRHPRRGRRDPDPERRRLRPGGRRHHRPGPLLGPRDCAASAPSPPPTAASATAPAGSRREPGRYVVLTVTFQLRLGDLGAPVEYAELARTLGVEPGARAPLADVRARRARAAARQGHGARRRPTTTPGAPARSSPTRSLDAGRGARRRAGLAAARRPGQDQRRLADRAGRLRQGLRRPGPRVALSTKHTLALTNRGGAHDRRAAGAGPRDPRRRARALRHHAGQRAGAGRLLALSGPVSRRCSDVDRDGRRATTTQHGDATTIADRPGGRCRRCPRIIAGLGLSPAAERPPERVDLAHGLPADHPRERARPG